MNTLLSRCLDDLAARIDEAEEARLHEAWRGFLDGELSTGTFSPPRRTPRPPRCHWPTVTINQALRDPEAMLLNQFGAASKVLANGGASVLNVRCNYGVSIMTSQLGCEVVEMSDEQGDLPTTQPLAGEAAIRDAVDRGVPDLRSGQGGDVFDTAERFLDVLARWPVLGRWVQLYHPDAQGPMDNAELAWGSDIFLAFYDQPELVHAFLELMTEHYLAFMRKWFTLAPPRGDHSCHWGMMLKGQVLLRDDSLMNLPPQIYVDFIRDREARCLRELGGGAIHFCGRGDHFIEAMAQMPDLTAVNLSQPHLNDMDTILRHTIDRGLTIIGLDGQWVAQSPRDMHGRVHAN